MLLSEIEAHAAKGATAVKEYVCRRGPRDLLACIEAYRGNELVAVTVPERHDRDLILAAFRACAVGFDADALTVVFETYVASLQHEGELDMDDPEAVAAVAKSMVNPLTGRQWGPGEMGDAVKNHGAIEKGWVSEAVSISCANRAGDVTLLQLPYRYSGKHLVWLPRVNMPVGAVSSGRMPDMMIAAMNAPSLGTVIPYQDGTGTRAERDVWAAEMTMKALPCHVALFADATNSDRVRVLRRAGIPL